MRTVWLATDVEPILTPEQVKKLEAFFADVDEGKRRRAIYFIDSGVKQYQAEKENPLDRLGAARQVTRIKNGLQAVIDELHKLNPAALEVMQLAAMKRADHADLSFWKLRQEVAGMEFCNRLVDVQVLCTLALQELPAVDKEGRKGRGRPKGTTADWDRILARQIFEAFGVAFNRAPKRLANDETEVDQIYKIIRLPRPAGILRELIESFMENKSTIDTAPKKP